MRDVALAADDAGLAGTPAGTEAEQRNCHVAPADVGVDTVLVALADLEAPDDVGRLAAMTA